MIRRCVALLICFGLAACGGHTPTPAEIEAAPAGIKAVQNSSLPPPTPTDLFEQSRPYLIGPFDKLTIDVFGIPEMSKIDVQTDASGRISFPLVGSVEAAGKTPQQLAETITERLRGRYIRDPQTTVNLRETGSQFITVDGEVREPGIYPVLGRMTLIRAIATAKGGSDFAKPENVVVFRTVGGQKLAGLYNLKAIRAGYYPDPEIYAGDVVVMGDSQAKRLFKDVLTVAPLLTTPLIVLLQ